MTNIDDTFHNLQSNGLLNVACNHSSEEILNLIDLTLLDSYASPENLEELRRFLFVHKTAAICVYPQHLSCFDGLNHIKKATVVNFPEGNLPVDEVINSLNHCFEQYQVDEIDYVFPYRTLDFE